jgi:hypothetical protein
VNHFKITACAVLCLSVFFSACSDNVTITPGPQTVDVSGIALGVFHQPMPNLKVRIGDKTAATGSDGRFNITGVAAPYDVYLTDSVTRNAYLFKGLTTGDVNLYIADAGIAVSVPKAYITVTAAPGVIPSGSKITVGFTNSDDITIYYNTLGNSFEVRMGRYNTLGGKVFLSAYTENSNNEITSYEVFGAKDLSILEGGNYNVHFESADVINPGERIINGTINIPPGYFNAGLSFVYMMFGKKTTPNYISQVSFTEVNPGSYSFAIPEGIPLQFKPVMGLLTYKGTSVQYITEEREIPLTGSAFSITTTLAPELLSPQNGSPGINSASEFSYSSGEAGSFIYNINFPSAGNIYSYHIYTSSGSITFADLESFGLETFSNTNMQWFVSKLGFSNTVDKFVSESERGIEYVRAPSETRTFTTAP